MLCSVAAGVAVAVVQRQGVSGLTLALLDLAKLNTQLDVAINDLGNTLEAQLQLTPGAQSP